MKLIIGIAQAVLGIIWVGILALITIFEIGTFITEDVIYYFKNINKKKRGNDNE